MITLWTTVLLASLFGSLHCAGMCGPLVTLYVGRDARHVGHVAYNLGRWVSYGTLGVLAGSLGQAIDRTVSLTGVQRISAIGAAILIVAWAITPLLPRTWVQRSKRTGFGRWLTRMLGRVAKLPTIPRAATVGVFSALLPCGWLYAFVAVAAGTGSWWHGLIVMSSFWLGSVPVMVLTGYGAGSVVRFLRARRPWMTAAILLAISALTLFGRSELVGLAIPRAASGMDDATTQAEQAADETPACCDEH